MSRLFITVSIIFLAVSCKNSNKNFDASGIFEATEIIVSSEANGKLLQFNVEEGQRVAAGEKLGYADTTQLHLSKLQLLQSAKSVGSRQLNISKQIAATQEQIASQQREKARTERLIEANAANTKQLDDINTGIAILERQLAAQQESLESSNRSISEQSSSVEIQVAQIKDLIAKSNVVSPITGTVLVKYAGQGEFTSIGKPLFKVGDIENMLLRAYITSGQLTQLKIGQEVKVFADYEDKGKREYDGTITWISDKSEFTPKTIQTRDERANLVYAVKIAVKNDGLIKIGMYGDVRF